MYERIDKLRCCHADEPEEEGFCWRAEAPSTSGVHVHLYRMKVVKKTPKGVWLSDRGFRRWKSDGKVCRTKQDALWELYHRKLAHARHARRRFRSALDAYHAVCRELGQDPVKVPVYGEGLFDE